MPLRALIFDFDGLIVDTESPSYEAWRALFTDRGVDLQLERWLQVVGTHDAAWDPLTELEQLTGEVLDRDEVSRVTEERFEQLAHEQPPRPGVVALLDEAAALGLRVAVASSSRHTWCLAHLERLGLADRFDAVVGRDLVGWKGKPDPAVYLEALRRVDVSANAAIALEDSGNGVLAATAAAIATVAVPNPITNGQAFDGAAAVIPSLDGVSVQDLLRLVEPSVQ